MYRAQHTGAALAALLYLWAVLPPQSTAQLQEEAAVTLDWGYSYDSLLVDLDVWRAGARAEVRIQ